MKELAEILSLWSEVERSGQSAVLATVVKTQGSSYRLPGARLLLTRDGRRAGSVSGGCLEDELIKKSWWFTESGPVVRRYDTTPDGEIASAYGLGCNGVIYILLERLHPGHANVLRVIASVRSSREPVALTRIISPASEVNREYTVGTNATDLGSDVEVFTETLVPPLRLLIFGAGDDVIPLSALAKNLGWEVFVVDGRAHYARREKFPLADQVLVRSAVQGMPIEIDDWTAVVIMSHSYSQDLSWLRELSALGRNIPYAGILGPSKRSQQLIADAELGGATLSLALHSPMGLDIGADGPEQVALSVVAEIQATVNGRSGGLLRERGGSIHARAEESPEDNSSQAMPWAKSIACV